MARTLSVRMGYRMKGSIVAATGLGILALSALAGAQDEKGAGRASSGLTDLKSKVSYSIGLGIGKQMKKGAVDIDPDVLARGLKDALAGKALMTDAEIQQVQAEFGKVMVAKQA